MQKKRIYILMAGVSLLLVSLIVIQLIWMRRAMATEQRETQSHVVKALQRTEDKLRNTNYCMITYSKLYVNPNEGFYMLHQAHDAKGFKGKVDTVKMYTNDEMYSNTDSVLYDFPTIWAGNYPMSVEVQYRMRMEVWDTADFYKEQKEFYRNVGGSKRVGDLVANRRELDSLFDMNMADSLLSENLRSENITAPYGFGFVSPGSDKVAYARRITDSTGLKNSQYAINFFADNKFIPPHRLAVVFPAGAGLYRINYWLIISIAIIALLTISFYVFVRLYLDQTRLSQMKTDFINNLTHEFNTPIANISLAIETLGDKAAHRDEKVDKILGIISSESARLRDNIEKALQAAAMDKGQVHLHKEEIDLVAIVKTILSSYQLQCEQLGGKIEFNHPQQLMVHADETHLLNCVCNLLDNAVKYRKGAPVITVTVQNEQRYATLIVTDNGMGMSNETQKHIFEKFYRAHEGDVHNTKGFGLGLSYVKGIIEAHNGKILVWSKEGVGTTFTIHLPK